jgi:hypothetical protein
MNEVESESRNYSFSGLSQQRVNLLRSLVSVLGQDGVGEELFGLGWSALDVVL